MLKTTLYSKVISNAKKSDETPRQWLKMDSTYKPFRLNCRTFNLTVFCFWGRLQEKQEQPTLLTFFKFLFAHHTKGTIGDFLSLAIMD